MPSGLIGSLARLWRERKAVTFAPGFWEALRPPAKSGATVNATSALECTTALACVQAIACGVAMLPLDIYRPREGGGRDVATDEPLWDFFAGQPNEWQTWPEWIETTLMHAVLCGDGISFINRPNPRGPIRELIPLAPGSVSVEQRQGYDLAYHLVLADGRSLTVGRDQVFHLRSPSWNAYSGLDATKLAREAIGLALATEEAHARLHANGARPGGILTTEQRLTRDQVDELRAAWQQTQGGLSNAMRTAVLSSGLKWEPMGMTGVDAQHIETRRFQIEEICRAFGVYPAMVGHSDKASTYASAEQFFIANVVYSLGRWTRRFEERIRVDLMTREERQRRLYAKFSLQALMRGDARTRSDFYSALITLGVLTRNEARGLEDLNPIPGLDEPLRPLNLATQAEAEAALRAKQAPQPGATGGGAAADDAEGKAAAIAAVARAIGAEDPALEQKIGRILSATNEARIRGARDALDAVLSQLETP